MHSPTITPPRLIAFTQRYWTWIRPLLHIMFWVLLYLLLLRPTAPRVFNDNALVIKTVIITSLVETIVIHYFVSLVVFPKFLYRQAYLKSAAIFLLLFFIVYQTNTILFTYLSTISDQVGTDHKLKYAVATAHMVQQAGFWGCFTDLRAALWNLSFGLFLPILTLITQGFNDLIRYQRRLVEAERVRLRLEVDFLKAQVNPHFLFNTLNSVYARIFEADQQAADLVLHLSELMRYNLYETDQPRISLDKELAYIQHYLDLERNRLAHQPVLIDYEQSGQPAHYQIAPLLLIAFVENAFKHGVKGATQPAYVQVRADVDTNGHFTFTVENSLPDSKPSASRPEARSGGVGLVNVRRRLEALYAGLYTLDATADQQAYTVTLTVQLEPTTASIQVY
ncbi:histidine kinase [Spirosoma oryzae]|uniref:Histidine kinase n=1 Tax=Spirosoma oryzae TaxID=1469603 RepID=A0A2T0T0T1_9BACT|nr:histidine kinase [Spirosoma oryzae]PRY39264.1 histidine kinase [Spirosoma oryzae]